MKRLFYLFSLMLFFSCEKEERIPPKYDGDTQTIHTVEGYLMWPGDKPVVNRPIALAQSRAYGNATYSETDYYVNTDSTGHFIIRYQATGNGNIMALYPRPSSYDCIFTSITILDGLAKGEDIKLGKLYWK